jgi:hypothetical protein
MRSENKPLLQGDPRFFQDITSTAVEVGLAGQCPPCRAKSKPFRYFSAFDSRIFRNRSAS